MTWDELKRKVDGALAEKNMDGSIEIDYFDFSCGWGEPDVYITRDKDYKGEWMEWTLTIH